MKDAPKSHDLKSCCDCPLWPPGTQNGFPTVEKIEACVRHVLGPEPYWMTDEEFLTQLEAQRQAWIEAPYEKAEPFQPGPFVHTHVLDWSRMYIPPRQKLIIPEDLL